MSTGLSPLDAPAIEPTDFEDFLKELGLDILPEEEQEAIADQARQLASYHITRIIEERLDEEQQAELAKLMDSSAESNAHLKVNELLLRAIPDLDAVVEDAVFRTKQTMRKALVQLPEVLNDVRREMEKQNLYFEERENASKSPEAAQAGPDDLESKVRKIVQQVLQESSPAEPTSTASPSHQPSASENDTTDTSDDSNGLQAELDAINNN